MLNRARRIVGENPSLKPLKHRGPHTLVMPTPEVPSLGRVIKCEECGSPLSLDQPSTERSFRLIGTCDDCGLTHLIDMKPIEGPRILAVGQDWWT